MRTPLYWHNVTHRKARTLATLAGVSFAILLIYMQLGFYETGKATATLIHRLFHYDIMLTSSRYVFLLQPGRLPRARLDQVLAAEGVGEVLPVYIGTRAWKNPETQLRADILVMGVNPDQRPFADGADLNDRIGIVKPTDLALMDVAAMPSIGPHGTGTITELGPRTIRVAGEYRWGTGFLGPGGMVVSESTFRQLFARDTSELDLGLVRLAAGADPDAVAARLRAVLPEDTRVWTRKEIETSDRRFFMNDRPTGLIFSSGVVLALIVGGVILFQVLSSEVANHLAEFATLQALGYTSPQIHSVVVLQGLVYAVASFLPASLLAVALFRAMQRAVMMPNPMNGALVTMVFVLSVVMCTGAALLATRRLGSADPADLFA